MPQFNFDSSELLSYEPTYRILICRECQYAIQKSAVQSHLLRHKIYRDDRQQLVYAIEQLDLPEPEDVQLPPPTSPPIEGLPVIDGFRCMVPGCGSLCASIKRMKKHHTDAHGNSDHSRLESGWDSVKLQTFFRGQKIRYFETGASLDQGVRSGVSIPQRISDFDNAVGDNMEYDEPMDDMDQTWQTPSDIQRKTAQNASTSSINLETLSYFHHYTTHTCHTLPTSVFQTDYWRNEIVALALQHQWLMAGVLAITACHLAIQSSDFTACREHLKRCCEYGAAFCQTFDRITADSEPDSATLKTAGNHIACIFRCAQWAAQEKLPPEMNQTNPSNLQVFIELAQKTTFEDPNQDVQHADILVNGRVILDSLPRNYTEPSNVPTTTPELRLYMLNRTRALTFRIGEVLGRPAPANDVVATLSAIAALVTCCELSFASEEPGVAWRAVALWSKRVPDYFMSMVRQDNAAALILVGYWMWLVQRAEQRGCWFLNGVARKMFVQVEQKILSKGPGTRKLIDGVGDVFR